MILSFGPEGQIGPSAALALGLPTLVALLAYAATAVLDQRHAALLRAALLLGWLAHAFAIFVDTAGVGMAESGARFGFAPVLSVTAWMVLAVYGVESRFVPLPGARRMLAALAMLALLLAWAFPGEFIAPTLSRWAPLHWVMGIASYGLFGVAVLHAVMLNRAERQLRPRPGMPPQPPGGVPLLRLERLTFRFVGAGFVVLSAALLLGAWVANPWRWDHKTVFSMLGWVVFAALLLGRQVFGWRGPLATRWLYAGVGLLLLAYVGSRFVLEVLLQRPLSA